MKDLQPYIARISELEKLLKQAEQKSDISNKPSKG
jgi:hypothetical protein